MNKAEFRQHQDDWRQALISHRKDSGRSLEGTTIRVALALQHYEHATEDEDQCCAYPTRLSLAVRLGLEGKPEHRRRTIAKHLTALEQAGFIVKIREGLRPSHEHPKGQPAKWRLTTPVEDRAYREQWWRAVLASDLTAGQKIVATGLGWRMDFNPEHQWYQCAWRSAGELAKEIGMAEGSVQNALAALRRLGWLESRGRTTGGRGAHIHRFVIPEINRSALSV